MVAAVVAHVVYPVATTQADMVKKPVAVDPLADLKMIAPVAHVRAKIALVGLVLTKVVHVALVPLKTIHEMPAHGENLTLQPSQEAANKVPLAPMLAGEQNPTATEKQPLLINPNTPKAETKPEKNPARPVVVSSLVSRAVDEKPVPDAKALKATPAELSPLLPKATEIKDNILFAIKPSHTVSSKDGLV